jgi:hypothetical protein
MQLTCGKDGISREHGAAYIERENTVNSSIPSYMNMMYADGPYWEKKALAEIPQVFVFLFVLHQYMANKDRKWRASSRSAIEPCQITALLDDL